MLFIRALKKSFWGAFATIVTIAAWFANVLQFVRNVLRLILDLPKKALLAITIFWGVGCSIGFYFMGGGVWAVISNIAAVCLILFLAYKIFNIVYMFVYALLANALDFFDFGRVINFFENLIQKAIHHYMDQCEPDGPAPKDRFLFAVPWIIHKINQFFEKLSVVISIAIYIISGGAGICFGYQWIFGSNTSDYSVLDHILAWVIIAIISAIAVHLGHCVATAIRMATESIRPLDELFSVYAKFFRNAEKGSSGKYTSNSDDDDYTQDYTDTNQAAQHNDNPYYEVLSTAKTAEELQKSYRNLAKKLHPDVCKNCSVEEATRRMAQLNNAYDAIKKRF